jgi:hypothetical protein
MRNQRTLRVWGIPESIDKTEQALCRIRMTQAAEELMRQTGTAELDVGVSTSEPPERSVGGSRPPDARGDDLTIEQRSAQYVARLPHRGFDTLILPNSLVDSLLDAVAVIRLKTKIFDEWGLSTIEPNPSSSLNFAGDPGTGKTLAAEAVAYELGMPLLAASYADIESKFHGDGPKNVQALFFAAERAGALLFIDEADSLLSRRLTSVTQGSEQAINSMRSQLLICLEQFKGIVVFATNLVENYDRAFNSRVRHFHFPRPDEDARARIWHAHLPSTLPLHEDVDVAALATFEATGRDIKNAILHAAGAAARAERIPAQADFISGICVVACAEAAQVTPPSPELAAQIGAALATAPAS